ncbi:MAG: hypothetical protein ABII93_01505 [Chrysiogenia bacterium]
MGRKLQFPKDDLSLPQKFELILQNIGKFMRLAKIAAAKFVWESDARNNGGASDLT